MFEQFYYGKHERCHCYLQQSNLDVIVYLASSSESFISGFGLDRKLNLNFKPNQLIW